MTDTEKLSAAIQRFERDLPGWWWSICHCALTRDASCGPDFRVLGQEHTHVTVFDDGFDVALADGSLADALNTVSAEALLAIRAFEAGTLPVDDREVRIP